MPKIKQLSPHEAQKIAAGEVVERPANIVKELLENSVDAGATTITLYVEDGGKKLIRLVDNGSGMHADDARICFNKHATSKIAHIDELEQINTFGFRGEALASISSVAHVTLTTKTDDTDEGVHVSVTNGVVSEPQPAPHTTGTDIAIHDLFSAIPARKKFLKTRETEWRHIHQLFQAFCFDYPAIHFNLYADGKQVVNCPPVTKLADRCTQLWEHNSAQHMIPIQATRSDKKITISGIVSNHQSYRYDRAHIFLFVNKRWIKNNHLSRALLKGYENVLPHGKFPSACITIDVEPTEVDINIHPRKEEVKFLHPRITEQLLQQAVKKALEGHISARINSTVTLASNHPTHFGAFTAPAPQPSAFTPFDFDHAVSRDIAQQAQPQSMSYASTPAHETQQQVIPPEQSNTQPETDYKLIGYYNKTYLLIEQTDGLYLIDQHAAHERVLYELFNTRFDQVATVNLMFPHIITLTEHDIKTIEPHLFLFCENGINIEPFGSDQLIVHATPVHLKDTPIDVLVRDALGWIHEYKQIPADEFRKTMHEKLRAQMACKAAVKAGDVLATEQIHQLLFDLHNCPNRFSCPHGRPTGWLMSLHEIEKKFRRKT